MCKIASFFVKKQEKRGVLVCFLVFFNGFADMLGFLGLVEGNVRFIVATSTLKRLLLNAVALYCQCKSIN